MNSWWSEHPDLEGVARRGRSELAQEAVAAERDVELLRKRRRSLTDVCFEWMSRGDLVTVTTGQTQFEGRLVAVVNDLIVMRTKTLEVGVNSALVEFVRSDKVAEFPGSSGEREVSSFRAQLGRYEVEVAVVRLAGRNGTFDLVGVIEASTEDHILVRDNQGLEWALPRMEIAYAISQSA